METVHATGGAQIGWVNASWPLATLTVSETRIRLSGLLMGTYDFEPNTVVALERHGSIPLFYSGVRIRHACVDYPSKIIFWTLASPEKLMEQIRSVGFLPCAPAASEVVWRGVPFRWTALILFVAAWNALFLLDGSLSPLGQKQPGLLVLLALLLAFITSWAIRVSKTLQTIVLRNGRSVAEIKAGLLLIQVVSGFLLVVFSILLITNAFPT